MAITEPYAVTATVGVTEWSMTANLSAGTPPPTTTPITDDGIYQVMFDVATLAAGDQFQFRVYEKVVTAGTQRILLTTVLAGVQPGPLVFPSFLLLHGWDVTAKKLAGTDRSIVCSIRKVA